MSLENRILQLESKLKAVSERTRKEIIWKKQLEDWILQNFKYDLRLQVELKLLEREETSLEDLERSNNFVLRGQTRITKEQAHPGSSPYTNTNQSVNNMGLYSSLSQVSPNVSISTLPSSSLANHPRPVNIRHMSRRGRGAVYSRSTHQTPRYSQGTANKHPRMSNPNNFAMSISKENELSTPIIVSTSSIAPRPRPPAMLLLRPIDSNNPPELITLDDDDDDESTKSNTNSGTSSQFQQSSVSTVPSTLSLISQMTPSTAPTTSEPVTTSGFDFSNNTVTSSMNNASANSELFTHNNFITPDPTFSGESNIDLGDSDNTNNDQSLGIMQLLQLENQYISSNYITRNEGTLMFNVNKILLDYEPYLHTELVQTKNLYSELPIPLRKRITSGVCQFLVQVYGEHVPREAKEAIAQSLFEEFPSIPKEYWFHKLPHKNATGLLEVRLLNLRKSMRDQRKRLAQDPSLLLV